MRRTFSRRRTTTLLSGLAIALACTAFAAQSRGAESNAGVNIGFIAEPSTSYVSQDTSLAALNDGHAPESSHVRGTGSYGNWHARGTQWVQYDWSKPISTAKIDVYWWDDRGGVRLPKACRLLYFNGTEFVPVGNPSGLGVEASKYNTTTFDEVRTSKLRLEMDRNGSASTGILEWKVYDTGKSPDFPPSTAAGIDRVVVTGGKTYLDGKLKTIGTKGVATTVAWSKASGPGTVAFADVKELVTTATFSEPGDYALKLTATKGPKSGSSTLTVKVIPLPPKTHLGLIDTKKYKIDSPLWNGRAKALIVNWIPHCIERISDPNLGNGGINNFINAADKLAGKKPEAGHRGPVFSNAWVYNTIESICVAMMVDPQGDKEIIEAQKAMKATLEDWIPKVLAGQEPDGYIQTFFTLGGHPHWSPRFRGAHEGYVAGYFLEAGVAHYVLTDGKDTRLYNAAKKMADCWYDNIGPAPKKPWHDGHQAIEIGLVRFGRFVNQMEGAGKGDKYIELSKFLLDDRGGGRPYDQRHLPVIQQYEALGHAVRASYSYAGMADVAMETGDLDYHSAVASLWDNIVNRKYYVTGGIGSGETSEGFGPNYSLRHNAYCESCSSCGVIFFQHKLNMTYHDAKYADLYEETLYNALLGSVDVEGKNFYYQNPMDCNHPRYPWHGCPCCVGNIPRTLLMLPTWTYSRGEDGIYVNLFVGSTVTVEDVAGTDVEMVQATDYPRSGKVSITVNPAAEKNFSVRVRVPNRGVSELYTAVPQSDGITSIVLNGSAITPPVEKGYAVITRDWKAGDKIDLVLPMKVQRIKGIDKIAATRGQVALRRGPLIYVAESADQSLDNVLSPKSVLKTEWRGNFLGGVTVIRGTWSNGSALTAVPYYARNNRSVDTPEGSRGVRSSVWLKDR